MSKFLVGWDEQSIVPDKKVNLCGQFFERIADHIETEITATAMAVETDSDKMIMVSVDIIQIESFLMDAIRQNLKKYLPDFSSDKIIVAATHTHTSIDYVGSNMNLGALKQFLPEGSVYKEAATSSDGVMTAEEATEFVAEKVALSACNAWNNRKCAKYANEFGRASVGMCRRVEYDDGTAQMWGDTNTANFVSMEGGNDSGIELIYMFDEEEKLTGIVANIACPAQILEHRSFISADFWGEAKAFIRQKLGDNIYVLALGGAGGDQCPRDLVRWVQPEEPIDDPNIIRNNVRERKADPSMFDLKGCRLVGKRIANEIVSVFEEIEDIKENPVFEHKVRHLNLPIRRVTMTDYNKAVETIKKYFEDNRDRNVFDFNDLAKMHVYAGTMERYETQQKKDVVPAEIHVVRLGDVAFATNPFELYLDYGNLIKARSYAKQTFIVQLSCGNYQYLPTKKAEIHGHYSAYVSSGVVGHEGGDILVRESLNEINGMWE